MEIPLEAINDVRFEQTMFERILGAGDLIIQSASESGRNVFKDIHDPEQVQRTIYHQGELNQQRMYAGGGAGQQDGAGLGRLQPAETEVHRPPGVQEL